MNKLFTWSYQIFYGIKKNASPFLSRDALLFINNGAIVPHNAIVEQQKNHLLVSGKRVIARKNFLKCYIDSESTQLLPNLSSRNVNPELQPNLVTISEFFDQKFKEQLEDLGISHASDSKKQKISYRNIMYVYAASGKVIPPHAKIYTKNNKLLCNKQEITTRHLYDLKKKVYVDSGKPASGSEFSDIEEENIVSLQEFKDAELVDAQTGQPFSNNVTKQPCQLMTRKEYDAIWVDPISGATIHPQKKPIKIGKCFYIKGREVVSRKEYLDKHFVFADTGAPIYLQEPNSIEKSQIREIVRNSAYQARAYFLQKAHSASLKKREKSNKKPHIQTNPIKKPVNATSKSQSHTTQPQTESLQHASNNKSETIQSIERKILAAQLEIKNKKHAILNEIKHQQYQQQAADEKQFKENQNNNIVPPLYSTTPEQTTFVPTPIVPHHIPSYTPPSYPQYDSLHYKTSEAKYSDQLRHTPSATKYSDILLSKPTLSTSATLGMDNNYVSLLEGVEKIIDQVFSE